ncbi:MAG: hypothetical protein ACI4II_07260 [Acutalibacteraceae bacterium]
MQQNATAKSHTINKSSNGSPPIKFLSLLLLVSILLCGCSAENGNPPETPSTVESDIQSNASSVPISQPNPESTAQSSEPVIQVSEPTTLEQELLAQRGISFDSSDYKIFVGGEGLLDFNIVFPDTDPAAAKADLSSVFVSEGKIYKFCCDNTLPGGSNCIQVGDIPLTENPVYLHSLDFNGADLDLIYKGGRRYKVEATLNSGPYTSKESQFASPYFTHTYRYSQNGKSLVEIPDFKNSIDRFVNVGGTYLIVADGKLYAGTLRQIKSDDFENIYFDDKDNGYIIWDVNCSAMESGETVLTLFNSNILVTDRAFYKVVYDAVPDNLTDQMQKITNSDGTKTEYLPKFGGGNQYRLEKIELLSKYYDEVATVTQSYVITKDYKCLPLTNLIPAEMEYSDYRFGDIEIPKDVHQQINSLY